jgi:hypothetical protein
MSGIVITDEIRAIETAKRIIEDEIKRVGASPESEWGWDWYGDPEVPGAVCSWSKKDEALHYLRRDLAALALVPHRPEIKLPEGIEMDEFKPCVIHYEEGDFSQMLFEDCATVTGWPPVLVEPLYRMNAPDGVREIVGFQWYGKVPHPPEGGKEAGEPTLYLCAAPLGVPSSGRIEATPDSVQEWRDKGWTCTPYFASPIPAGDSARAEDPEERRERILETIVAPDNGTVKEVLTAVLHSANAWVPEARIVGNVRAGDISRAVSAALTDNKEG